MATFSTIAVSERAKGISLHPVHVKGILPHAAGVKGITLHPVHLKGICLALYG